MVVSTIPNHHRRLAVIQVPITTTTTTQKVPITTTTTSVKKQIGTDVMMLSLQRSLSVVVLFFAFVICISISSSSKNSFQQQSGLFVQSFTIVSTSTPTTKKWMRTTPPPNSRTSFSNPSSVLYSTVVRNSNNKKNNNKKEKTTANRNGVEEEKNNNNNNNVDVPKQGGRGVVSAAQLAVQQGLSLGAPPVRPRSGQYTTHGGIDVTATIERLQYTTAASTSTATSESSPPTSTSTTTSTEAIEKIIDLLDSHKGVLLTSSYEFPGRYARWSLGFVNPPIQITGKPNGICIIEVLNIRGLVLIPKIQQVIQKLIIEQTIQSNVQYEYQYDKLIDDTTTNTNTNSNSNDILKHNIPTMIQCMVVPPSDVGTFSEEDRSRQPSLFSIIRAIVDLFGHDETDPTTTHSNNNSNSNNQSDNNNKNSHMILDKQLGLYGAFGYDLTFQFEPIHLKQPRNHELQRDLILYLPDEIVVVDQDKRDAWKVTYEFSSSTTVVPTDPNNAGTTTTTTTLSTEGLTRSGSADIFQPYNDMNPIVPYVERDTPQHEFAASVELAKREFAVGNLFETVLSQTFREKLNSKTPPSKVFRRLRTRNPSPYSFFINVGQQEYLVGASPEMFVRCEATYDNNYRPGAIRVETCPISGTVARGADALEDAQRVKSLMMNVKEESELTMCTDVDRNDKSRICEPGSVQVIGRRQIEMYSRLIHTVDHVEGYLRPEFDALDAFLCHTWAVTVTGAPKTWAIQFIEDTERSPRCWYGGAVGFVGFDGSLNTGLTLRTVRIQHGIAEVRAGATLLYDSSPPAEELETELKASALIDAIVYADDDDEDDEDGTQKKKRSTPKASKKKSNQGMVGTGMNIILIDHEDSFVHTLGNYLRQTGAIVTTLRSGPSALQQISNLVQENKKPDLVVLSPGPGNPSDFGLSKTLSLLIEHNIPAFGVCLGLQGMVEHFGGTLGVLSYPMHGKPSQISLTSLGRESENSIFVGLPESFEVARYHSLHGIYDQLPDCLDVTALSVEDQIVMAIQHKTLPYAAVQFHPESILTSPAHGMQILQNALSFLKYPTGTNEHNEHEPKSTTTVTTGTNEKDPLETLSVPELKRLLVELNISTTGNRTDLIQRMKVVSEKKRSMTSLDQLSMNELRELKKSLSLKGTMKTKAELMQVLKTCLSIS